MSRPKFRKGDIVRMIYSTDGNESVLDRCGKIIHIKNEGKHQDYGVEFEGFYEGHCLTDYDVDKRFLPKTSKSGWWCSTKEIELVKSSGIDYEKLVSIW